MTYKTKGNEYAEELSKKVGCSIEFDSNEEIRTFLLNEYPKSREYKPCYVPGFWLDIDD